MLCGRRSLPTLHFLDNPSAAKGVASVGRLVLHASIHFLRPIDFLAVGKRNMHTVADRLWVFRLQGRERRPGKILYARRTWASPVRPIRKYILSLRNLQYQSVAGFYASGLMRARRLNNSSGKRIPGSGLAERRRIEHHR